MLKNLRDDERPGATGEKVPVGTDEEIRKRLLLFARKMFDSWGAMERATGIPHTTAVGWKKHGASLPGTESLIKLAREGLSLDWLVTGRGQMQMRLGELERGALLEDLRPSLQRRASVGDATGQQAFSLMILKLGVEGALEQAAMGLFTDFESEVRRLDQLHRHSQTVAWVDHQLGAIEERFLAGSTDADREAFALLRRRLFDFLPEDMRPGAQLYSEYWDAVTRVRASFVEQARATMGSEKRGAAQLDERRQGPEKQAHVKPKAKDTQAKAKRRP
jgi:hypothetical protein